MDTFYQIAVIMLICSILILWIFFMGLLKLIRETFEKMTQLIDEIIKEMG